MSRVPIEVLVNAALLYAGERDIVQFDVTYYDARTARVVEKYAATLDSVVVRRDASGNLVVYLASNAARLEAVLKRRDGTVEGAQLDVEAPLHVGALEKLHRTLFKAADMLSNLGPLARLVILPALHHCAASLVHEVLALDQLERLVAPRLLSPGEHALSELVCAPGRVQQLVRGGSGGAGWERAFIDHARLLDDSVGGARSSSVPADVVDSSSSRVAIAKSMATRMDGKHSRM